MVISLAVLTDYRQSHRVDIELDGRACAARTTARVCVAGVGVLVLVGYDIALCCAVYGCRVGTAILTGILVLVRRRIDSRCLSALLIAVDNRSSVLDLCHLVAGQVTGIREGCSIGLTIVGLVGDRDIHSNANRLAGRIRVSILIGRVVSIVTVAGKAVNSRADSLNGCIAIAGMEVVLVLTMAQVSVEESIILQGGVAN